MSSNTTQIENSEDLQDPGLAQFQNSSQNSSTSYETSENSISANSQYSEPSEMSQNWEETDVLYPSDYEELEPEPSAPVEANQQLERNEENRNRPADPRSSYLQNLLEDQQDFIRNLETAENQLMLDENFMLLVSDISNKNSQKMFECDHRDENLRSKFLNF